MKAKTGFELREVCGEKIIIAEGRENIDFSNIICMSESAAYLWTAIKDQPAFSVDDLTELLLNEYEVEREQAYEDAKALAEKWIEVGIVSQ